MLAREFALGHGRHREGQRRRHLARCPPCSAPRARASRRPGMPGPPSPASRRPARCSRSPRGRATTRTRRCSARPPGCGRCSAADAPLLDRVDAGPLPAGLDLQGDHGRGGARERHATRRLARSPTRARFTEYGQPIHNDNGERFSGSFDLGFALTNSINTVFAQIGCELCPAQPLPAAAAGDGALRLLPVAADRPAVDEQVVPRASPTRIIGQPACRMTASSTRRARRSASTRSGHAAADGDGRRRDRERRHRDAARRSSTASSAPGGRTIATDEAAGRRPRDLAGSPPSCATMMRQRRAGRHGHRGRARRASASPARPAPRRPSRPGLNDAWFIAFAPPGRPADRGRRGRRGHAAVRRRGRRADRARTMIQAVPRGRGRCEDGQRCRQVGDPPATCSTAATARAPPRRRRHGTVWLAEDTSLAPQGRDQGARRALRRGRAVRRALPPRGAVRRRPEPPEHRRDLRPRRGRGHVLHRDGVPGRARR